jgi:hypothetical protein
MFQQPDQFGRAAFRNGGVAGGLLVQRLAIGHGRIIAPQFDIAGQGLGKLRGVGHAPLRGTVRRAYQGVYHDDGGESLVREQGDSETP